MRGSDSKLGRMEEEYSGQGDYLWEHLFFNPGRFDKKEINQFQEELYQKKGRPMATIMKLIMTCYTTWSGAENRINKTNRDTQPLNMRKIQYKVIN